jgi:hypothetical protein
MRRKGDRMKEDKKIAVQLNSSEFELILAALYSFQNQRHGRDTRPDYSGALEGIIARINCDRK